MRECIHVWGIFWRKAVNEPVVTIWKVECGLKLKEGMKKIKAPNNFQTDQKMQNQEKKLEVLINVFRDKKYIKFQGKL